MCPEAPFLETLGPAKSTMSINQHRGADKKNRKVVIIILQRLLPNCAVGKKRKMLERIARRSKAAPSLRAPKHTTLKNSSKSV